MPAKSPKKPSAPKQPKKPTSKSKTGNSACSQAASNWQLAIRGKAPLDPGTYKTLAQCRSMTAQKKSANLAVHSGKLNEQGRDALVGRLQKRADQGLLYKKDREARLNMLLKERKAKQQPPAQTKPAATLKIKESVEGTKAVAERMANAEKRFVEHAMNHAGLTKPQAETAMAAMIKAKAVKMDPHVGQFSFTHGAFGDKAVIRRAAGLEQKPPAPAFSLSSGPQFGVNGKNAQGVLFSTPTGLDKQVHADQAARGKPLTGQTSMFDKPAAPVSREAALVQKVRGLPGYGVAKASATANRELVGFRMKEKAKPPTPKFSRNGQLAPGRGTEERKQAAHILKTMRQKGFSDDARLMRKQAVYRTSLVTGKKGPVEAHHRAHLINSQARELQESTIRTRVRISTEAYNQLTPTGKVKKKSRVTAEQVASDRSQSAHAIRLGRTISKARYEVGITDPVPYSKHIALTSRSLTKLRNALMPSVKPTPAAALPAFVAKRNAKPTSSASAIPEGYKMEPAETVQLGYYNTGGVVPKAGKGRKQAGVFVTEPDGYKRFFDNERAARKWLSAQ